MKKEILKMNKIKCENLIEIVLILYFLVLFRNYVLKCDLFKFININIVNKLFIESQIIKEFDNKTYLEVKKEFKSSNISSLSYNFTDYFSKKVESNYIICKIVIGLENVILEIVLFSLLLAKIIYNKSRKKNENCYLFRKIYCI